MHLFARLGFRGATTRQIAEAAGVNEAIIFRHFPTKEDLYWAIIEGKCRSAGRNRIIRDRLAEGRSDRETFVAIAEQMLTRSRTDQAITRLLLFSALERHELSERFFQLDMAERYERLAAFIRQRIAEGAYRDVDPLIAARAFLGMIVYHHLIQELFGGSKLQAFTPRQVAEGITDIWLAGMKTRRPRSGNGSGEKNGNGERSDNGHSNGDRRPRNGRSHHKLISGEVE